MAPLIRARAGLRAIWVAASIVSTTALGVGCSGDSGGDEHREGGAGGATSGGAAGSGGTSSQGGSGGSADTGGTSNGGSGGTSPEGGTGGVPDASAGGSAGSTGGTGGAGAGGTGGADASAGGGGGGSTDGGVPDASADASAGDASAIVDAAASDSGGSHSPDGGDGAITPKSYTLTVTATGCTVQGMYYDPANPGADGFSCSPGICTYQIPAGWSVGLICDQPGWTYQTPILSISPYAPGPYPNNSCARSDGLGCYCPFLDCGVVSMTSPVAVSMGWTQ